MSARYFVYGTDDIDGGTPDLITEDPLEALAYFCNMVWSGDFEVVQLAWSS